MFYVKGWWIDRVIFDIFFFNFVMCFIVVLVFVVVVGVVVFVVFVFGNVYCVIFVRFVSFGVVVVSGDWSVL